jgi:hypothetical protein
MSGEFFFNLRRRASLSKQDFAVRNGVRYRTKRFEAKLFRKSESFSRRSSAESFFIENDAVKSATFALNEKIFV